jgi:tetratricopeptide (TPR) repeat protein
MSFIINPKATLCLGLAILAIWLPSLGGEFVYDSKIQIASDDFVHTPSNFPDVISFRVLGRDVLDFNRPVMLLSLLLDSLVVGRSPFGYRLSNVLLHCVIAMLAFQLLARAFRRPDNQTDASLLAVSVFAFAAHPICAEVVCEPSNREDALVALFSLGALLVADIGNGSRDRVHRGVAVLTCVLFSLLAIGSKETGVALPFMLLAWWFFIARRSNARWWLSAAGASLVAVAIFTWARFAMAPGHSEIFYSPPRLAGGTLAGTIPVCARIFVLYLRNVFWPAQLCADYSPQSIAWITAPNAYAILGILAAAFGVWSWRDRRAAFLALAMLAALAPISNFVPMYRPAADRYLYLPLIFGAGSLYLGLATLVRWRGVSLGIGVAIALLLCGVCLQRQGQWDNRLNLWSRELQLNPSSLNARMGYSTALIDAGKFENAEAVVRRTLIDMPKTERADLWATLARALDGQGRVAESNEATRKALALEPRYSDEAWLIRTLRETKTFAKSFATLATRVAPDK